MILLKDMDNYVDYLIDKYITGENESLINKLKRDDIKFNVNT
jgi:hypothetical protein